MLIQAPVKCIISSNLKCPINFDYVRLLRGETAVQIQMDRIRFAKNYNEIQVLSPIFIAI